MSPRDAYTHGHAESVLRSHASRTADNSAAYLLPHLRPGMDLLDIGCGPGTITTGLAARVAPGRTVGVDLVPAVVAAAVAAAPAGSTAEFAVADAYALPYADASFDVVHAHQVLQHLSDPVAALREWRRVCRPGGIVAARDSDYSSFAWYPPDPLLDRWLALYKDAARANRGEPDAGRLLLAWAHAAGLAEVTASATAWTFADPEARSFWGGMWADRVIDSALTTQLRAAGVTDDELESISEAFRRWAEHPDGWFIVPCGEILCRVP